MADSPIIPSITANPNPLCTGTDDAQLHVNAFGRLLQAILPFAPLSPAGPATAGPTGDDTMSGDVAIGFTFPFFGVNYTTLYPASAPTASSRSPTPPMRACCAGELLPAPTM